MVSASRMTLTTSAYGNQYTPAGGEQGGDGQHK